ncbi:fatty acid elongase [Angomonas deanei]|uniref:Elongation of fatty acids protein n=1 Tax=Angomonas deanei TaxID=59799 RepID=A0A7G2C2G4_9TRYP|nr:fatty acid elongase [Angomonas deanei]CAD2213988.1 GNS1/SUR4 family, putative [Angomonas deanei]|eukprot:EPY40159.1 fatty acid elongase [Angomonas deanei]
MYPWIEPFTGTDVRVWMGNNVDVCAVLCFLYLGMIRYGPNICKSVFGEKGNSPDPAWLRYAMVLWNLFLSAFSCSGMIVMVPALIKQFAKDGWHNTLCIHHDELLYSTTVGFWTGLFALSKIFELIDTVFLVLQKQKLPPFLHWYHHVSVLIFSWMSYTVGNSTMAIFAAMNITVHTIMYFYFAVCAMGLKRIARPFAKFITTIQILQMVGGSVVTFYSFVVNFQSYQNGIDDVNKLPCAVNKATARFGSIMYLSYLYLFSKLFVNSYMRKPAPRGEKPAKKAE